MSEKNVVTSSSTTPEVNGKEQVLPAPAPVVPSGEPEGKKVEADPAVVVAAPPVINMDDDEAVDHHVQRFLAEVEETAKKQEDEGDDLLDPTPVSKPTAAASLPVDNSIAPPPPVTTDRGEEEEETTTAPVLTTPAAQRKQGWSRALIVMLLGLTATGVGVGGMWWGWAKASKLAEVEADLAKVRNERDEYKGKYEETPQGKAALAQAEEAALQKTAVEEAKKKTPDEIIADAVKLGQEGRSSNTDAKVKTALAALKDLPHEKKYADAILERGRLKAYLKKFKESTADFKLVKTLREQK